MPNLNNITRNLNFNSSSDYGITSSVRFYSYIFSSIASILCSLFVLYYLLFDRALRCALYNHIIIILLIMDLIYKLTDIPLILFSDRWGVPVVSSLFHQVIPTFNIIIFSVGLLLRVLCQKRKLNQQIRWNKYRKMTIQLLSISMLYLLFNAPWVFVIFAYQYGLSANIANILMSYTIYLYYYVVFLFPFVCCGTLPELRTELKQKIPCWPKGRQVMPIGNVPNGAAR